jgi:hypothetical protein
MAQVVECLPNKLQTLVLPKEIMTNNYQIYGKYTLLLIESEEI